MTNSQKLARAMDRTESTLETTEVVIGGQSITVRMVGGQMVFYVKGRPVSHEYVFRLAE